MYTEGDVFSSRGFVETPGAYRVGIDFDGRTGMDHPYRWGFGAPLAPGESRVVTGAIKLTSAQSQRFWAGLVQERVAWLEDRIGTQAIAVTNVATGAPRLDYVAFALTRENARAVLNFSCAVTNASNETLTTQGPNPGFVYDEEKTFTADYPAIAGACRVGVDCDGREGIDHPYRWGFGAPLAPGESRAITGKILLARTGARNFWAGLVQEQVAWLQDRAGITPIAIDPLPAGAPKILSVALTPSTMIAGQVLQVSVTVRNDSNEILSTQDPAPGLGYDEGETFQSRGFDDVRGAYRVGIDFDGRIGIDHPYRWGLGAPLAPGETRVITGAIKLTRAETRNFWAGLGARTNRVATRSRGHAIDPSERGGCAAHRRRRVFAGDSCAG